MPKHKYNSIAHRSKTGLYCDYWIEHSHTDVEYVIKLEEDEQERRIKDKDGEHARRNAALKASEIIHENLRPVWFGRGSLFVLNLLKAMRKSGNNLLRTSQILSISFIEKLGEITHKGKETVETTNEKIVETTHEAKEKIEESSRSLKGKFQESSDNLKEKFLESSNNLKGKLQESSHDLKVKVDGTIDAAHHKIHSATEFANQKIEKIGDAVSGAVGMVASDVSGVVGIIASSAANLLGKIKEKWSNLVSFHKKTTIRETEILATLIKRSRRPEEENERAYRLSSEIETFAIFNALLLSSLIKELAPEFYRPDFEPTRKYSTRLLEEIERRRRMVEDLFDRKASENAKTLSAFITEKFSTVTPTPATIEVIPLAKKEEIEPIKVSPAPMGAAM